MLIQAAFALIFLAVALALHDKLVNDVFEHQSALYDVLVVGTLAYAASYFARGWLAGHQRFGLFGGLVLMESVSRIAFAIAVAIGIAGGQTAVALGIAAAPFVSLVVVPAAFARTRAERERGASRGRRRSRGRPRRGDHRRRGRRRARRTGHRGRPGDRGWPISIGSDLSLRRGGGFAVWVSGIMLSEQTLLNAAVLTVDATARHRALAGIVFNVLLIARAPLQLFQAIQTSLLPHLTGPGGDRRARGVRARDPHDRLAILAFAAVVTLGLLIVGPFALRHVFFGQSFSYKGTRPGADRHRHGPAPDLGRAQPGRARARPGARGGRLLAAGGGAVRRVDADAGDLRTAAARGGRLRGRDSRAGDRPRRAVPAGHAPAQSARGFSLRLPARPRAIAR